MNITQHPWITSMYVISHSAGILVTLNAKIAIPHVNLVRLLRKNLTPLVTTNSLAVLVNTIMSSPTQHVTNE